MNAHLFSVTVVLFAAGGLAACAPEPHQPNADTGVSPSTVIPTSVIGDWASDSTEGVEVFISEDSGFGLGGQGCAASGNWTESDGQIRVSIYLVPGIAGCPESMTLDRGTINSLEISAARRLVVKDSRGNSESFTLE